MKMQTMQQLRRLSVRLDVNGEANEVTGSYRLYKDGFGFMGLRCYVPKTVNYTGKTLCTVFRTVVNAYGEEVPAEGNYEMCYIGEVKLSGLDYLLFECPCPKEFTNLEGELNLTFNYCDCNEQFHAINKLTSAQFRTTVTGGGWNNAAIKLELTNEEAAKINANTAKIEAVKATADEGLMKANKNELDLITTLEGVELAVNQSNEALLKSDYAQSVASSSVVKAENAVSVSKEALNVVGNAVNISNQSLKGSREAVKTANTAMVEASKANGKADNAFLQSRHALFEVNNVRSPVTGIFGSIQTAIDDLLSYSSYGITAGAFDGLNLSASACDHKNIAALDFDTKSKFILIGGN